MDNNNQDRNDNNNDNNNRNDVEIDTPIINTIQYVNIITPVNNVNVHDPIFRSRHIINTTYNSPHRQ
jgi:hypothetical protein